MEKLLTISIAAYNVEQYIDNTIETIINAGVSDNLEVLVVNDGSKDNTREKALHYQELYPETIRLVDKENGGHGSTINTGIREATGKYFKALDGDDWIESDNLRKLVDKLEDIDSEIILTDYCECFEDGRNNVVEFEGLVKGKEYSFDEIAPIVKWMRYHTVIYKTDILKDHEVGLDEHCFYVDTEFMLYPIPYVNKIYYAKDYIYCYRLGVTGQSVSRESRIKHIDNSMTVAKSILSFYDNIANKLGPVKEQYIISGIANHCIWHLKSLLFFDIKERKKKELVDFDTMLKEKYYLVYSAMSFKGRSSVLVNILRKTRYTAFRLVALYKKVR